MMKTKREKFKEYIEETLLNKLVALGLLATGIISAMITKEGNLLVLALLFGLPVFFSKKNCIK